ncbi:unnamed protein product [Phyllotreta striolata]|uniref:Uncharacterized protein n=1 Tax=Phyllotreta striolata TaxID=444603 RepID=A0A9N9XQ83_PHYSR|nr:unnamed protein product [Phyllotreta striolata]
MLFDIFSYDEMEIIDSPTVRIEYGPYEAHGVIKHRIQRLYGLIRNLVDLGFELDIRKVVLINRLQIIMYNRKIFQCNIKNLKFNMTAEYDLVCQRIVDAVVEASKRMQMQSEKQLRSIQFVNDPEYSIKEEEPSKAEKEGETEEYEDIHEDEVNIMTGDTDLSVLFDLRMETMHT